MRKLLLALLALTVTFIMVGCEQEVIIQKEIEIVEVDKIIIEEHLVQLTDEQLANIEIISDAKAFEYYQAIYDEEVEAYKVKSDEDLATAIDELEPVYIYETIIKTEIEYIDKVEYVNTTNTVYVDVIEYVDVIVTDNEMVDSLTILLAEVTDEYEAYMETHSNTNISYNDTANYFMGRVAELEADLDGIELQFEFTAGPRWTNTFVWVDYPDGSFDGATFRIANNPERFENQIEIYNELLLTTYDIYGNVVE